MAAVAPASQPLPADVHDLLRRGREALEKRRYGEAAVLFDRALAAAPDDREVQALAVTAEFWRRLARDGDGLGIPPPVTTPRLGPFPAGAPAKPGSGGAAPSSPPPPASSTPPAAPSGDEGPPTRPPHGKRRPR